VGELSAVGWPVLQPTKKPVVPATAAIEAFFKKSLRSIQSSLIWLKEQLLMDES
jgi:hypothetical protein